jgi:hypothetical protein
MSIAASQLRRSLAAMASGVVAMGVITAPVHAQPDWDQVANVKDAATRLGKLQKRQGASKAFQFIVACYKTHGMATKYSKYFEACIAQDYIHTQTLALIYARVPPARLKKMGAPSPELLAQAMGQRVAGAFAKYSVSPADANAFKKLIDLHGFAPFNAIVFPKSKSGAPEAEPEDLDKPEADNSDSDKSDSEKQPTP